MAIIRTLGLLGALALCAGLAGCAEKTSTPPPTPRAIATLAQAAYANAKSDVALWVAGHPSDAAIVTKFEQTLDPEIAALSSDQSPASISAALGDLQNHVNALPSTVLSTTHKEEISALLSMAQAASLIVPAKATAPPPTLPGAITTAWVPPQPVREELVP